MAADDSAEDLPDPVDSTAHTRRVPAVTPAALRFSGRWSSNSFRSEGESLTTPSESVASGLTP